MTFKEANDKLIAELSKDRPSNKTYKDYLRDIFKICRDTLNSISQVSVKESLPYDFDKEIFKKELLKSTNALLRAYNAYSAGLLSTAIQIMRNKFLSDDVVKTMELTDRDIWYRARIIDKHGNAFQPKDMFHIPFEKRTDVINYRYSITGYPCLYIASSILSCWKEMHTPQLDSLVVSKVKVSSNNKVKIFDLRIPNLYNSENLLNPISDEELRHNNLMLLKTWPLIIACSIKTITPDSSFKYEYIHPQLLMLAIKEHNSNIYGVAFTSTQIDKYITDDKTKYTNIAIPVRKISNKGYCSALKELFVITRGVPFMEANIKNIFCSTKIDVDNDALVVSTFGDGSSSYEDTKFGQLEKFFMSIEPEIIK